MIPKPLKPSLFPYTTLFRSDRDVHDPRRRLHAELRLLRDRARHARLGGPRGARTARPGGGRAGPRICGDHVGQPGRPRRRRRRALGRDGPRGASARAALPRGGPDPRLPGANRLARDSARGATRHPEPQHRDGGAPLQGRAARRPLRACARALPPRARSRAGDPDQVRDHPGSRRGAGRAGRDPARPARGRGVDPDARPVPPAVAAAPARLALLPSRRVRRARGHRSGARVHPCRGGTTRPQLVPRQASGGRRGLRWNEQRHAERSRVAPRRGPPTDGAGPADPGWKEQRPAERTRVAPRRVPPAVGAGPAVPAPTPPPPVKPSPFECGKDPIAVAEGRFAIKFSTIAIFFILIDIELMFIWPWAVIYRRLGWFGFAEMMVFLGVLMLGFLYIWRKGGLEWD